MPENTLLVRVIRKSVRHSHGQGVVGSNLEAAVTLGFQAATLVLATCFHLRSCQWTWVFQLNLAYFSDLFVWSMNCRLFKQRLHFHDLPQNVYRHFTRMFFDTSPKYVSWEIDVPCFLWRTNVFAGSKEPRGNPLLTGYLMLYHALGSRTNRLFNVGRYLPSPYYRLINVLWLPFLKKFRVPSLTKSLGYLPAKHKV